MGGLSGVGSHFVPGGRGSFFGRSTVPPWCMLSRRSRKSPPDSRQRGDERGSPPNGALVSSMTMEEGPGRWACGGAQSAPSSTSTRLNGSIRSAEREGLPPGMNMAEGRMSR